MLSASELSKWVAALRVGQVLVCPTETQYGLLADARNPGAIAAVCGMKGRAQDAPLALLLPNVAALDAVATHVPDAVRALAKQHWPGPLTLLVPARPELSPALTKDGKVGVRVPGPSSALELVQAFGGPVTATSANLSGQPPVATPAEALAVFGSAVAGVVSGRPGGQAPSTIVDASVSPFRVLRSGPVQVD